MKIDVDTVIEWVWPLWLGILAMCAGAVFLPVWVGFVAFGLGPTVSYFIWRHYRRKLTATAAFIAAATAAKEEAIAIRDKALASYNGCKLYADDNARRAERLEQTLADKETQLLRAVQHLAEMTEKHTYAKAKLDAQNWWVAKYEAQEEARAAWTQRPQGLYMADEIFSSSLGDKMR